MAAEGRGSGILGGLEGAIPGLRGPVPARSGNSSCQQRAPYGAPLAILALLSADDGGRPADERVAFFVLARLDDDDRVTGVLDAELEHTAIVGLAATAAGAP